MIPLIWALPAGGAYAIAIVALALWIRRHELIARGDTIRRQAERIGRLVETNRLQRAEIHRLQDSAAIEARVTNALADALGEYAPGRAAHVIDQVTGYEPRGGHRG
jgi:hypothetical protein